LRHSVVARNTNIKIHSFHGLVQIPAQSAPLSALTIGGGLAQLVATLVGSTKLLYAGPG